MNEKTLAKNEEVLCEHAMVFEENGEWFWYDGDKTKLVSADATIIFDDENSVTSWVDNTKTQITFTKPKLKRIETIKTREDYEKVEKEWLESTKKWKDFLFEEVEDVYEKG